MKARDLREGMRVGVLDLLVVDVKHTQLGVHVTFQGYKQTKHLFTYSGDEEINVTELPPEGGERDDPG